MTLSDKKARKGTRNQRKLIPINADAAELDVGATFHVVAVPPDRDEQSVRTFNSFTAGLNELAEWLQKIGIRTVAMESTGVYWIPVYEVLEAKGFEVLLVNARDVKHVPGRKTDVNDAQWIQQLHAYGLLRGSFRPREQIVQLRAYLRHRERLIEAGRRAYSAYAKGSHADERAIASCGDRRGRPDRHGHHQRHYCR